MSEYGFGAWSEWPATYVHDHDDLRKKSIEFADQSGVAVAF